MAFEEMEKPAVGEATKREKFAAKVIDNLNALNAASGGSVNPILNPSFELTREVDGVTLPVSWEVDNFTVNATTVGAGGVHGERRLRITNPGSGGGQVTSNFFEVAANTSVYIQVWQRGSAGVRRRAILDLYNGARDTIVATTTVFDDSVSRASYVREEHGKVLTNANISGASSARFARLRLIGDGAGVGTADFDNVVVRQVNQLVTGNRTVQGDHNYEGGGIIMPINSVMDANNTFVQRQNFLIQTYTDASINFLHRTVGFAHGKNGSAASSMVGKGLLAGTYTVNVGSDPGYFSVRAPLTGMWYYPQITTDGGTKVRCWYSGASPHRINIDIRDADGFMEDVNFNLVLIEAEG